MKLSDLKRAQEIGATIAEIDQFLSGYDKNEWRGSICLQFGSYECDVGIHSRGLLLQAIYLERAGLVDELKGLGVVLEENK
jgi:hypothetical protein